MLLQRFEQVLSFKDISNNEVARVRLVAEGPAGSDLIASLSATEAIELGEETIQIYEGHAYQYEVLTDGIQLEQIPGLVERFLIGADSRDRGILNAGLRTGLLRLQACRDGIRTGTAGLEVRSIKIGYREDYRAMLDDIAEISVDLLLQLRAPTEARLVADEMKDVETVQQRFFFVKGLLENTDFMSAVQQIIAQPHVKLSSEEEESDPRRATRISGDMLRQLASQYPRQAISMNHPLAARLVSLGCARPTVPARITVSRLEETLDTPENQFFKHALETFEDFLQNVEDRLGLAGPASVVIAKRDVAPLRRRLEGILTADFFRDISAPRLLELNSPVLLRKAGYREILQAWTRFNAAARLVWHGGEDVYGGGKRDVAVLYEYWIFFVLWDVISKWADQQAGIRLSATLLEPTADGFGLKLRSGNLLALEGLELNHKGQRIRFQFSYNRTFAEPAFGYLRRRLEYRESYPAAGSWTRRMRPDFTFSFWPSDMEPAAAEEAEMMVHIHFDSKYSVDSISELFGSEDSIDDKRVQSGGNYKRSDLLKMHAYRDAIRRSQGAYVLYPGVGAPPSGHGEYTVWLGYHELLPGLGAFTVRPGAEKQSGVRLLECFLHDVMDHLAMKAAGVWRSQ